MAGFVVPKLRHERTGGGSAGRDPLLSADLMMTKRIAEVVQAHYPGHPWLVEVNHEQGIAMISLPLFMGVNKYVIPLWVFKTDPMFRCVVRACGEILERYRIPRQRFSLDHFEAALSEIPPWLRARKGLVPS
jgi:hypothetical protein